MVVFFIFIGSQHRLNLILWLTIINFVLNESMVYTSNVIKTQVYRLLCDIWTLCLKFPLSERFSAGRHASTTVYVGIYTSK